MDELVLPSAAESIAVIGMSCRFPGADGPDQYWANVRNEVESIRRPSTVEGRDGAFVEAVGHVEGIDQFDAGYFRVPPADAALMDPQARLILQAATEALEDSGYARNRGYTIGTFVGSGENVYAKQRAGALAGDGGWDALRVALTNEVDFLAPRISFKLGLTGPSLTIQASCSTGLSAIALACQSIAAGDCDIAVAGGVSLLMPDVSGYPYVEGGINSRDGRCRAFDRDASGTVPASGVGVVILKRDSLARADGDNRYALVKGWAINNDGGSRAGFTVPNVSGQEAVIRRAMERAGVPSADIGYVEAHGTGTPLGDPIEIEALARAFDLGPEYEASCPIGSVKTNIGHTDAAAGVAGFIKTTFAVRDAIIPASLNFSEPNPAIDFQSTPFYVNGETRPWPGTSRVAGVSSFGLGGSNAHVVVANATPVESGPSTRASQVITVSARTRDELAVARERLADWLESTSEYQGADHMLADVSYSLAVGRSTHEVRWAGSFGDAASAAAALRAGTGPASTRRGRLAVAAHSGPAALVEVLRREIQRHPVISDVMAEYGKELWPTESADPLSTMEPHSAGALALLVLLRALSECGVSISDVDAPSWARPALEWRLQDRPVRELLDALGACGSSGLDARAMAGPDVLLIGPDFDFGAALAAAWARGAEVDWLRHFSHETRVRRSLPAYPFSTERHWLEPAVPSSSPTGDEGQETITDNSQYRNVGELVAAVWSSVLGMEELDADADFYEMGGDSISALEIGAQLNEALGLELPLDLAFQEPSVSRMTKYVSQAISRDASL